MTMKENQNGNSFDSISFGKETDPLTFGSKNRNELNDSRMDSNLTELEAKETDDLSNFKCTDDSSIGNEKGTMGSPKKTGQNGLLHHLCMDNESGTVGSPKKESEDGLPHQLSLWDKDTDSLSSDSSDIDKEQRSPEHESFDTVEEFVDSNQSDSRDSNSPLFTVKNVLECDLPELEVCYKEIDCQILKDICIDEGRNQKVVNEIESCMDEKPGGLFPQPPNDTNHFEAENDSSLESESFTSDQCGSKEENDGKTLVSQERVDTCLENSLERDTVEHYEPENAAEAGEAYFDATGKAETDYPDGDSLVDRKLPIEDFDTPSSLGTDGGNKVILVPDQVLIQEAVPESPAALSAEAGGAENDVEANCLLYNSKVENGSITFNFSSSEGLAVGNGMAENVEKQCADKDDVHNKDVNAENLPDAREAKGQCTSNRVGNSHGQPLKSNEDGKEQSADLGGICKDVNVENLPDASEAKVQGTRNRVGDSHGQSLISNEDGKKQSADLGDVPKDVNAENLADAREAKMQDTSNRVGDSHEQFLISNGDDREQSADLGNVRNVSAENLRDAREVKVQGTRVGDSHEQFLISNEDDKEQSADLGDLCNDVNAENLPDAREAKVQGTINRVGDSHELSLISNEDVKEQSADSGYVHKDLNAVNLADATEGKVLCTSNIGDSHGKSLISNIGNSDGGSSSSYDQCVRSNGSSCENGHEGSPDHKKAESDDVLAVDPAESPSNKNPGPTNDAQAPEPIAPNHDGRDTGDVPVFSHLQHDMGETSFSAASLITYSGPIAFSGSLSHRSDGSTTSGKSFAFPVLQSEWNSSPVRMAKADRRHFRKQKGWRSGLLCCRF